MKPAWVIAEYASMRRRSAAWASAPNVPHTIVNDPTHTSTWLNSTPALSTRRPSAKAAASLLALITKPASDGAAAVYASRAPVQRKQRQLESETRAYQDQPDQRQ